MTPLDWREQPISRRHDRAGFDCRDAALNQFLRERARQSHERGAAKTYVATDETETAVLGYYTLAPAEIDVARAPASLVKGLGRHPIAGFRLGRLAVDRRWQGGGLGGQLLLAAGRRCLRVAGEVGGTLLFIDAKDAAAARWYADRGAVALVQTPLALALPLATLADALARRQV
jgi:GNAT superfamily N-acetyltransferase